MTGNGQDGSGQLRIGCAWSGAARCARAEHGSACLDLMWQAKAHAARAKLRPPGRAFEDGAMFHVRDIAPEDIQRR
jgi:hypothetical protein